MRVSIATAAELVRRCARVGAEDFLEIGRAHV